MTGPWLADRLDLPPGSWLPVALCLAVVAAGCLAAAAVLQQRVVMRRSRLAAAERGPGSLLAPAVMLRLPTEPRWLAGVGLGVLGTALHISALALAPVAVIQPVGVLAVPLAVLLGTRRLPSLGVAAGVLACTGGIAVLVGIIARARPAGPPADDRLLLAASVVAALVAGLAVLAWRGTGRVRCVAAATGAAIAFGLASTVVRAVLLMAGTPGGAVDAGLVALVVAGLGVGGWLVQQAFAAGAPAVVVGILTVVDPIVAVCIGVLLLDEGAGITTAAWAVLWCAALVAAAGVGLLVRHHPAGAPPLPQIHSGRRPVADDTQTREAVL